MWVDEIGGQNILALTLAEVGQRAGHSRFGQSRP